MEYHNNLPGRINTDTPIDPLEHNLHPRKNFLLNLVVEKGKATPPSDIRQYVQKGLETVERSMLSQVEIYHPDLKIAAELVLTSNGKRLRPRIILLIGKLLGANFDTLVTLASSIEMLHTASLVHDDLIDGSLLRRGMSTLNANWSPAATILTGDFLFAAASDMAAKTNSVEVMRLFSRTLMTIVNGEINQLFVSRASTDTEEYYRRIYAKTASLFETSAQAAAMLSTADAQQIELFRGVGFELGMAFQIVDDLLDYTGDESTVGKPVGGDLRQGIITLPLIYYIKTNPNDPAIQKINNGVRSLNDQETQSLLYAVTNSNAIEKAMQEAGRFVVRAETCLMCLPKTPERDALVDMGRYVVERKK